MTTKNGAFTLTSTKLKDRSKKTMTEVSRKTREKRRQKLISQQEEAMTELEQRQREHLVVELMKRQSAQEKELEYESWRTAQCKQVIIENRKLRQNQYEKRRELDVTTGVLKEEEMLKSMRAATDRQVAEMSVRNKEMRVYEQDLKKKDRTSLCASLMDAIFDIADEAYNHRQDRDSTEFDPCNNHEWLQLFKSDMPIASTLKKLSTSIREETGGESESTLDCSANDKLDELELVDYLKNQG